MPACPPTCPKVRQELRKALEDGEITPPSGYSKHVSSITKRSHSRFAKDPSSKVRVDDRDAVPGPSRALDPKEERKAAEVPRQWRHKSSKRTYPLGIITVKDKRELAEQQRIVDQYFLTKGFNYFDDVCTCTLSCIVRSLRQDSFVRSLLTSTALFALGIKLCYELNHWYLPARL